MKLCVQTDATYSHNIIYNTCNLSAMLFNDILRITFPTLKFSMDFTYYKHFVAYSMLPMKNENYT